MQQLVILLVINCFSTCFGRLYAHHQEVRLRFTAYGFLSCCSCCDVGESGGKLCALCGVGCLTPYLHHIYYLIGQFTLVSICKSLHCTRVPFVFNSCEVGIASLDVFLRLCYFVPYTTSVSLNAVQHEVQMHSFI